LELLLLLRLLLPSENPQFFFLPLFSASDVASAFGEALNSSDLSSQTSALMTGSNRQSLASSVSPNNSSNPSSSSALKNPKNRNAHHSRKTSWASGLDKGGEPTPDSAYPQQRRRADSLAHVSEGSSGRYEEDDELASASNMALRNTSLDWNEGHARSRSQSQPQMAAFDPIETSPARPGPVTWMSLPRKKQLALLGLCRVFDFLQIASLQAYMFYQLKSFDETLSDSDVSTQAGILQGAFTAAQFATAIPWGRVADAEWGGRKFVLLVGLLGTAFSCLGVAYSTSFAQAVFWRSFGGAINGTVGIIRTMIAENVKEKKYHSRAFLILPIGFNIAALFGPGMTQPTWSLSTINFYSHGWNAFRSSPELPAPLRSQLLLWR
jgi:hypothetical protein